MSEDHDEDSPPSEFPWGFEEMLERLETIKRYIFTLTDPSAQILYESPHIERFTGYAVEEYLGSPALDFVHPEDRADVVAMLDQLYRSRRDSAELAVRYRWHHKDGRWLTVNSSGTLIERRGQVVGMMFISHETTHYHEEMERFKQRIEELERHNLELLAELKSAGEERARALLARALEPAPASLIKLFDRELRTPLHTIQGYAELLLEEPQQSVGERALRQMHRSSQELAGLIERLVELARYEEQDLELQLERVDLESFCRGVIGELKRPIGLSFEVTRDRGELYTDAAKLGATLREQAGWLLGQGASGFKLVVRDQDEAVAIGWAFHASEIGEPARSRLERALSAGFALGQAEWGREYLSVHLGRRRVLALGGEVTVSERSDGTCVWDNVLPRHAHDVAPERVGAKAQQQRAAKRARDQAEAPAAPPRLLLVGDGEPNLERLKAWCEAEALSFEATLDGDEAIERVRGHGGEELSVVLLDVLAPHLDGWRVLMDLRRAITSPDIKLIVYAALEDDELARELGADDCLHKFEPFERLRDRLLGWLKA